LLFARDIAIDGLSFSVHLEIIKHC
jgi:hypothetical protein